MNSFDEREREAERRFALDEEIKFKIIARRNRLVALWAGHEMGLDGGAANTYARDLVELMFHPGGSSHIVERLVADLDAVGKPFGADRIRRELDRCEAEARRQLIGTAGA